MPLFEHCSDSLETALAAGRGGAHRIELCTELEIGGVTPPAAMIEAAVHALTIPVHVLVRPRGGDFVYTNDEFTLLCEQIEQSRRAGAAGVVAGVLRPDGCIDVERSRALVNAAGPLRFVFHRAFDQTSAPLEEMLEAVIATGAHGLLTSGRARNCMEGADTIAQMVRQAAGRIEILAGAGLKLENVTQVTARTGAPWLHGSLKRADGAALEEDIRTAVTALAGM
jgi:copper homeostasis protein